MTSPYSKALFSVYQVLNIFNFPRALEVELWHKPSLHISKYADLKTKTILSNTNGWHYLSQASVANDDHVDFSGGEFRYSLDRYLL